MLDLSRLLPGPMACRHLADLGAQVLKVEPPLPGRPGLPGDDAAYMGPGEDGVSHFYRVVNHGKRRLVLDLKQPEQLDHLRALVREAHAVVEGFRPGVMERLGLGYEALQAINPAIVLTSISGYGQEGPLRLAAGHDLNYLALAGVVDQTRTPDGLPLHGAWWVLVRSSRIVRTPHPNTGRFAGFSQVGPGAKTVSETKA